MVLPALQAIGAGVAGSAGIDGDALADAQARDARAQQSDRAGDFVAEHHRLFQANSAEAAVVVVVEVRPADAANANSHQHFTGLRRRNGRRVDAQIPGGVDDGGSGCDLRHEGFRLGRCAVWPRLPRARKRISVG